MDRNKLDEVLRLHKMWLDGIGGGERADLRGANLQGADLRGANLDYSCLSLWCGGSRFKASPNLAYQIAAHMATIQVEDADEELKSFLARAKEIGKKSHRAGDLGLLD